MDQTLRRLLTATLLLVLVGCSTSVVATASPDPATAAPSPAPVVTAAPTAPPTPAPTDSSGLVPADLNGVLTTPELAHRLPLAVAIDDSRAARPQSGFNAASVVYQAPADGYEVRYLLMFQEQDANDIGPVRSARNYIAHWTAEVGGALAHYGGDRITRHWMKNKNGTVFTDVDGIGAGNPAYHRIGSREAPHNAYTSTEDLWRVAGRLGAPDTFNPDRRLRPFRDDSPVAERGTSQQITVPYNTVTIGYTYDPATNAYLRSVNGRPHIDPMDEQRVTARTVVVLYMTFRTDSTIEPGHNRPVLGYIGSGKALIFSEGNVVEGTWSKADVPSRTLILGPNGKELSLVRGRIFIQVVPLATKVTIGA
jgi:Protein of unknown function (DUF3048) N-terminal domain/Protein of unknown function (DUF3048) C-terminal domain